MRISTEFTYSLANEVFPQSTKSYFMSQPFVLSMLLGGAPDGNWIPVLFVLIGLLLAFRGAAWCVHYLKRKIRDHAGSD